MKQLTIVLLAILLPTFAVAQDMDKKLFLIEYPPINSPERIKSIDARTYEAKMDMSNYSQTKGELLDTEKTTYSRKGFINFKESERKSLNQKMTVDVKSNHTDFSTTQKQGKHSSKTTTVLTEQTPLTTLYTIEEVGVGVTYKTKEIKDNILILTTQDQNRLILSVDTIRYNAKGYPVYQNNDVLSERRQVEYRHQYDERGWITSTYIKTINILKNREEQDEEEETSISQRYQYIHEDKFHNWLTRYTFNQNNKLMNITERKIDYY